MYVPRYVLYIMVCTYLYVPSFGRFLSLWMMMEEEFITYTVTTVLVANLNLLNRCKHRRSNRNLLIFSVLFKLVCIERINIFLHHILLRSCYCRLIAYLLRFITYS